MHPISSPPPPPPQSYSRIHRPWIDQDGTVTSSTHTAAADSNSNSSSSSCSSDGDQSDRDDSQITDNSMDKTIDGDDGPTAAHQHNDRVPAHFPSVALPQPTAAHTFDPLPAGSAFSAPHILYGSPLATAQHFGYPPAYPGSYSNEMELAYQRVLAEEARAKQLSARKQRPKRFVCPHCCVAFSNNGQLQGHIRIHTGERPYRCDGPKCGKTFTRNEELTRHKRIHSGVRPYACSTCGKRFGRRDHLKKHARTHLTVVGSTGSPQLHYHPASLSPFGLMGSTASATAAASSSAMATAAAVCAMIPIYPYIFG